MSLTGGFIQQESDTWKTDWIQGSFVCASHQKRRKSSRWEQRKGEEGRQEEEEGVFDLMTTTSGFADPLGSWWRHPSFSYCLVSILPSPSSFSNNCLSLTLFEKSQGVCSFFQNNLSLGLEVSSFFSLLSLYLFCDSTSLDVREIICTDRFPLTVEGDGEV